MNRARPLTLKILDKDYVVACPESERFSLLESVDYLNEQMKKVKDSGKVLGTERIAVIAALTIVHELLQNKETSDNDKKFQQLSEKIKIVLAKTEQI